MKNSLFAVSRNMLRIALVAVPSVASAMGRPDGGILSAPEFDAGAAGTVAAVVIGGAILLARRRSHH